MDLKYNINSPQTNFIPKEFEVDISDKWNFPSLGHEANFCINVSDESLLLLSEKVSPNIGALNSDQQICFYLALEYMKTNDQHANQSAIKWLFNTNETISDIDIKCNISNFLGYCETKFCPIGTE